MESYEVAVFEVPSAGPISGVTDAVGGVTGSVSGVTDNLLGGGGEEELAAEIEKQRTLNALNAARGSFGSL